MKLVKRIGILGLVFLAAFSLGILRNPESRGETEAGSTVEAASLPVLCADFDGALINPLYAYTAEMKNGGTESVFPFTDGLSMTVHLLDGNEWPRKISYEVRSEDGARLVERGEETRFSGTKNDLGFSFGLQDILEPETYYRLNFVLELPAESVHYYTRVIRTDAENITEMVRYARTMHEELFRESTARTYAPRLETDNTTDKNTLAKVNINSSFEQVSWGDSNAEQISDTWLTIRAVQENYGYFSLKALVNAPLSESAEAEFCVTEELTLQRSKDKMYLLQYDRDTRQLWHWQRDSVVNNGFLLGVQDTEQLRKEISANGKVTAFAVAGELYTYSAAEKELTRIFSFRSSREKELRTLCRDYDIRIVQVENDGSMEFLVYGYMNGGRHEGSCGISYFSYDAAEGTLSEKMFISAGDVFPVLKDQISTLFAKGSDELLYFYFDDCVYVMDFSSGETAVLITREESGSLVVNQNGNAFAWQSGSEQTYPKLVRVVNLEKGTNLTAEAPEGEFLRSMGFVQEDFVLGYGRADDPALMLGQSELHPLYRLDILDESLTPLLSYSYPDIYIDSVETDEERLLIKRHGVEQGKYCYLSDDVMLRGDGTAESETSDYTSMNHDTLMRLTVLPLGKVKFTEVKEKSCRSVYYGKDMLLPQPSEKTESGLYSAYLKGNEKKLCSSLGEAVAAAEPDYGYVFDGAGTLLWYWGSVSSSVKLESANLSASPVKTGADISGISFRAMRFFLDRGRAVLWLSPDLGTKWIIGYEKEAALVYSPESGKTERMDTEELERQTARDENLLTVFFDSI